MAISTTTPEYLALQKCYDQVIRVVSADPGLLCDALFSEGLITESVRNYTRSDSIPDVNKARKLIDNVMDQVRDNPTVFHTFIKTLESPHYNSLKKRLNECYQTEKSCESCFSLKPPHSPQVNKPCPSKVLEEKSTNTTVVNTEYTSQTTTSTSFVCPYCSKCSLEQYLSNKGCPEASGKTLFPYLNTKELSKENRMVLEDTLTSAATNLKTLFAHTDTYILQNLHADVKAVKNFVLDLVRDLGQDENEAEIKKATSIPEIILALQPYKSFLNYEIIETIVTEFGSPEDCAKMQKYVTAFNDFCKRSAFKLPSDTLPKQENFNEKILSVKFIKKGLAHASLGDIVSVRRKTASVLGVKPWALRICSIEDGCVCVRFLVPAAVMSKVFPLSPAKKSALREVDISIEEEQLTHDDTGSR